MFSKCGTRGTWKHKSAWKHTGDENGEEDYSKTEMYALFLQNSLMICEEPVSILEKERLTASELFDVKCRLQ